MNSIHRSRSFRRRCLVIGAFALLTIGVSPGSDSAVLKGSVTDSAGHPLAGIRVRISGDGVGSASTRTGPDGAYRSPGLRPFVRYRIAASFAGYRTVEYDGMVLEAGRTRVIDFRLRRPGEREIVVLASRDPFPYVDLVRAFSSGLTVPTRVIDLDAESNPIETVRRVTAERPDLILGAGLRAARLVRGYVHDVPAILTLLTEPRHYDLEAPNICFVASNPDARALLRRLTALLPAARRLGLIYQADDSSLLARDLREAARAAGLTVDLVPCRDAREIEGGLRRLEGRVDSLLVPFDRLTEAPGALDLINGWALRNRIPTAAPDPEWVKRGALFAYSVPAGRIGEEASRMARQIIYGARQPSEFDLHTPENPLLAVNRETAESLGVTIPDEFGVEVTY